MLCSSNRVIKYSNEVAYVALDIFSLWSRPVKHIEQLEVKSKAIPSHCDVIRVKIAVIIPKVMDLFNAHGECMEQVYGLERAQTPTRLPVKEIT